MTAAPPSCPPLVAYGPLGGGRGAPRSRQWPLPLLGSVALHGLLLALLSLNFASKGTPGRTVITAYIVPIAPEASPEPPATVPEREPPLIAATEPKPQAPLPKPRPEAARETVPEPSSRTAKPPSTALARNDAADAATGQPGDGGESSMSLGLLNAVRANWLRPAASPSLFRCQVRIDYLAGGIIANVVFLNRCGGLGLDGSVHRAIWKTQPLPLAASRDGGGSLVFEFFP